MQLPSKEFDSVITLYGQLYDHIQKASAKNKGGKPIVIVFGESHKDRNSLLAEEIVRDIAQQPPLNSKVIMLEHGALGLETLSRMTRATGMNETLQRTYYHAREVVSKSMNSRGTGYERRDEMPLPPIDIINEILASPKLRSIKFTEKLHSSSHEYLYKVYAEDQSGNWASYFILTSKLKAPLMEKELASGDDSIIDLEQFGSVIVSYYGADMPDYAKRLLTEKYGYSTE